MNFDKFLILQIFTYCSYRDIIRWKRVNKFFYDKLNISKFWNDYKNRRQNGINFIIKYMNVDNSKVKVDRFSNAEDMNDVIGHFLISNIEIIETMQFYNVLHSETSVSKGNYNPSEFLYLSANSMWSWDLNYAGSMNSFLGENDGLSESDYNPETGLPYYYEEIVPEPEFDDSYKALVSNKLKGFFKEEDALFIEPYDGFHLSYEPKIIARRNVIGALPEIIVGKIFSLANNPLNIILTSKKFCRIFLTHTCPPWLNNAKGLIHASKNNLLNYFAKWQHLAGNRYDIQECLSEAVKTNSINIVRFISGSAVFIDSHFSLGIRVSNKNLLLSCSNLEVMKIFFEQLKKDDIPTLIREAKRIEKEEVVIFLQNGYNTKLLEEKQNKMIYIDK